MRHRMLSTINTEKHYNHNAVFTVANGAITPVVIVNAVTVANKGAASNEVEEGSLVKAVYLEFWVASNTTVTGGSGTVVLEKVPANATAMTHANAINLGAYLNKKNVLEAHQGLTSPVNAAAPLPILMGWYKIPKGKQRMGLGDKIVVNFASITNGMAICGMSTYKEWK